MSAAWAWFVAFLVMSGLFCIVMVELDRVVEREHRLVVRLIRAGLEVPTEGR